MHSEKKLVLTSIIISSFFIFMMAVLFFSGNHLISQQAPRIDAILDIRLEIKSLYICLSKLAINTDKKNAHMPLPDSCKSSLKESEWYFGALLRGAKSKEGQFYPVSDKVLRDEISALQRQLKSFRKSSLQGMRRGLPLQKTYKKLDSQYRMLLLRSGRIETGIQSGLHKELKYFRILGIALLIVSILGAVWLAIYLHKTEKNKQGILLSLKNSKKAILKKNLELENLAHFDQLTRLPNRNLFESMLKTAIAEYRRRESVFALLFIDLDYFKAVNDNYGHHIGDLLLKKVASRITACIREVDGAGRISGDEFTVILKDVQDRENALNTAQQVAEKIVLALRKPYRLESHVIEISASIGIALCPYDSSDEDEILKMADQAMYQAKLKGKNDHQFFTRKITREEIQ